jgi:hypothetical protein
MKENISVKSTVKVLNKCCDWAILLVFMRRGIKVKRVVFSVVKLRMLLA